MDRIPDREKCEIREPDFRIYISLYPLALLYRHNPQLSTILWANLAKLLHKQDFRAGL